MLDDSGGTPVNNWNSTIDIPSAEMINNAVIDSSPGTTFRYRGQKFDYLYIK
jgi:hypothetical protein